MRDIAGSVAAPAARCRNFRRGSFILNPPSLAFSQSRVVGAAGYGLYGCAPAGSRTVNTEPLPGSLVTVTSPPIMRQRAADGEPEPSAPDRPRRRARSSAERPEQLRLRLRGHAHARGRDRE